MVLHRYWSKSKFHFQPGLHLATIEHLEEVYANAKRSMGIDFFVPCEASEDETAMLQELRWNQRRDALPGT